MDYRQKCLEEAMQSQPEGVFCGFCGQLNVYADDCGFFYKTREDGAYVATCNRGTCPVPHTSER